MLWRGSYPRERSLAERLRNEPFVLLGVNCDCALARVRPQLATAHITWRSFWNGPKGIDTGIAGAFGVRGGPTSYILDGRGVIRFTKQRFDAMDAAVDQLLAETREGESGR